MALQCGCSIPAAERLDSSAEGTAQLVAHEAGKSILYVKGGYAALHKLLWWHWRDMMSYLIFCSVSAKFEFGVFLLHDTMLTRYILPSCVRLCSVDVAYWQLSGLICSELCTDSSTRSRRVHSML